jgi:ParB-like chromosome segregation protein Spo0J
VKGLSSYEVGQLILSVGTHRSERPLSPVEVAKFMQRALDAGEKRAEIAGRLHLEDSTIIGHFTRLLSLPAQVQQLVGWGSDPATVSFTAAATIARLQYPQEQSILTKAALENQFRKSEIIQVVQIWQRSKNPIENCIKAVLDQRPIVEKRHLIIGELRSEELKAALKQVSQLERNNLLQSTLERYVPDIPSLGCKLGDVYFLLVGDDRFHAAITSLPSGFEKSITEYLVQELGKKD